MQIVDQVGSVRPDGLHGVLSWAGVGRLRGRVGGRRSKIWSRMGAANHRGGATVTPRHCTLHTRTLHIAYCRYPHPLVGLAVLPSAVLPSAVLPLTALPCCGLKLRPCCAATRRALALTHPHQPSTWPPAPNRPSAKRHVLP